MVPPVPARSEAASPRWSRSSSIAVVIAAASRDFAAIQRIAAATGGSAFAITDPAEINKDFFESLAHTIAAG